MKKFVISEDERRRILSMHESATKRQYLSEQPATTPNSGVTTADATFKPTFTDNDKSYYVPGLNDINFNEFTSMNSDYGGFVKQMKLVGADAPGQEGFNIFAVTDETVTKQIKRWEEAFKKYGSIDAANDSVSFLKNLAYYRDLLGRVNKAYLVNWRPNLKGLALLQSPKFLNDEAVLEALNSFRNFKTFYPKVIKKQRELSGLTVLE